MSRYENKSYNTQVFKGSGWELTIQRIDENSEDNKVTLRWFADNFKMETEVSNINPSLIKEIFDGLLSGNMTIVDVKKNYFDCIVESIIELTC